MSDLERELKQLKEELEVQTWGLKKANEGVKLLYKELEKKNEELRALDQMKTDFISNVSHELRTPLTTMREVHAQLLEGLKGPINDDQRKFLTIAQSNVERLVRIVNNLLDLSRLDAGRIRLERSRVELTALARETMETLRPLAAQKHISIEDRLPVSLPKTYADEDRIKQVIVNLIGNAIKYSDAEARITVSAEAKDDMLVLTVTDTGAGIPAEFLDRVFNRFERASKVPVPGVGGAGLGLTICKELIQMHKGDIWVESELGKGSSFGFSIPVCGEELLLKDYLDEQLQEAERNESFVSLLTVTIDDQAYIQENLGAGALDEITQQLREVVTSHIRDPIDRAFALREGELGVVLVGTPKENTKAVKKRIQAAVEEHEFKAGDKTMEISLEFDEAAYPTDGQTAQALLEHIRGHQKGNQG
jgi:signal transduction histidine kinase/GGDEF domain-containing protein